MKVTLIPNHSFKHMWLAYIQKLLKENPIYSIKKKSGTTVPVAVVIKTKKGNVQEEIISYATFKGVIERFCIKAKQFIINGESINIPYCGIIAAKRIERDFRAQNKSIDWKRTTEAGYTMVDGKKKYNKVFYHITNEYCRIGWFKPMVKNTAQGGAYITVYVFDPTASSSPQQENATIGFKQEFSQAIMKDPFLKFKYIYCPIRDYVPQTT